MNTPLATAPVITIERAKLSDARAIRDLIQHYADQEIMLPRSLPQILSNLRDFTVARVDGELVGCVAVHIDLENLAEIRSLAVDERYRNHGLGRRLIEAALEDARILGVPKVYALTYIAGFFEKFGFKVISKDELPQKVWADCVQCPHFYDCKEIAVMITLQGEAN